MARVPPSQRSSRKNWEQPNSHRASQTNQPKSAHDRRSQASNGRLSQHHKNVRPPTAHSNSRSPVESSSRSRRPSHHLEDKSGKCSQICTIRGILQIVEIMTGILVLICVIASYAVITGYTSAAGFGSFSIDSAYSPFEGNELKQVRDLDMQYSQLRVPGIYGGVPFILLLCGLTIFFLMVHFLKQEKMANLQAAQERKGETYGLHPVRFSYHSNRYLANLWPNICQPGGLEGPIFRPIICKLCCKF
ncbi:uncharacterized protein LOC100137637 isoform X2 [Xenopus laevis]|uniref:Uncharacterized protein LOC100137637 isoform X2 n=1 Tax=Xenopus laevis TaxID=8355 RepID=A0A8J1KWI4_XENLA|nr:uncharacterized protein LOC100137637 isoform X2 [Xenopus laevis]